MRDSFPDASVAEFNSVSLDHPTVVAGFVGAGLVGPIAISHIVSSMPFKEFACMRSRHMPPAAVFIRGHLQHPFRFYANEESNMCAIICETTIHMEGIYDIISAMFEWMSSQNAKELVILDGIASDKHDNAVYYAAEKDTHNAARKSGIEMISRGFLTGISGGLLDECLLHKVHGSALLAKADKDNADPLAAATLVDSVNSLYGTNIETASMRDSTAQIGTTFAELSKKYAKHRDETRGMYM